jgi:hypothetical protein
VSTVEGLPAADLEEIAETYRFWREKDSLHQASATAKRELDAIEAAARKLERALRAASQRVNNAVYLASYSPDTERGDRSRIAGLRAALERAYTRAEGDLLLRLELSAQIKALELVQS